MTGPASAPSKAGTKGAEASEHEPRKLHGDKLGVVSGGPEPGPENRPGTGDSAKHQGDPMEKVIRSKG
jgi:hypothetical protein